jgi:hypothetical protein
MCSTRKTRDRFGASSRKPAAAVAEDAEVAEAAEAAEVAGVVEEAAEAAPAEPAVCRGELAAFADSFLITLENADHHGRVR